MKIDFLLPFILKDNLYAVQIIGQATRLSNPKHSLVTYSKDGIPFLDPLTGASKINEHILTAKSDVIKMNVRLERIAHFITSPDPINLSDFKLAEGTVLNTFLNI